MAINKISALISAEALERNLNNPCLRIIDASWHMPAEKRDARAEYANEHIPGAVFFDIDVISDRHSPYPHMLPSAEDFAANVSSLGIGSDNEVVICDTSGIFSAARAWWMFRIFGHDKVRVLDGGLIKWKVEGRKLESGIPVLPPSAFHSVFKPELLWGKQAVADNIIHKRKLLLDARAPGRFMGIEPEPRPGLRRGHIEGSINIFFKDCLSPPYNTLKPVKELRDLFAARSVDSARPLAATCGSGVTACILALALYELGNKTVPIYDGAWAEWGSGPPEPALC